MDNIDDNHYACPLKGITNHCVLNTLVDKPYDTVKLNNYTRITFVITFMIWIRFVFWSNSEVIFFCLQLHSLNMNSSSELSSYDKITEKA